MTVHHHVPEPHPVAATTAVAAGPRFSVGQAVCLIVGILYVVLGVVGLVRADMENMTRDTAAVGPFSMTGLLAFIALGLGVVFMASAAGPASARSAGIVLGTILIAAGIIALIQEIDALGWNPATGVLFLVTGIVALAAALITPPVVRRVV